MLDKLVVYRRTIAHHQQLCCRPMMAHLESTLEEGKESHYIFNSCSKVFWSVSHDSSEATVLHSEIMWHKMANLNMVGRQLP